MDKLVLVFLVLGVCVLFLVTGCKEGVQQAPLRESVIDVPGAPSGCNEGEVAKCDDACCTQLETHVNSCYREGGRTHCVCSTTNCGGVLPVPD